MPSLDTSTVPEIQAGRSRSDTVLLVLTLGLVAALVLAAGLGLLGVTTTTAAFEEGGYRLEVHHASVTRPGLATEFGITLSRLEEKTLPPTVSLRVSSDYLSIFDENGLDPFPSAAFADTRWVKWTFEIPEGSRELSVALDARLEPSVQARRQSGSVGLIDGESVVEVEFVTWILP